jgi:hypothetical protein
MTTIFPSQGNVRVDQVEVIVSLTQVSIRGCCLPVLIVAAANFTAMKISLIHQTS